tara:strand:+ start:848 stop:1351 length:504 start_codon:yes stop_codon:yes gene_type:complete
MSDQAKDFTKNIVSTHSSSADRKQLSNSGLKAFHCITEGWGLSLKQRCTLLGDPALSTYRRWLVKIAKRETITLSKDTLIRISAILGIHKHLTNLFSEPSEALIWLKGTHNSLVFSALSPLGVMLNGTQDDLLTVRRYLETWPYSADSDPQLSAAFNPVKPEDIVFR